ncbi:IS3 family transposase, partial [Comamonas sp. A23]|uniref:IS3 family transposase n=1 Tax=Comamonas sp. A23 TaxID=2494248 RepID=UPI001F0D6D21
LYSRRRGRPSFENCSIVSTILQAWTRCPLLTALSIWGHRTDTLFYPGNWQSTTIEQFIEAVDAYIRWYNEKRIKVSLGRLSPVEYRHKLGLAA